MNTAEDRLHPGMLLTDFAGDADGVEKAGRSGCEADEVGTLGPQNRVDALILARIGVAVMDVSVMPVPQ